MTLRPAWLERWLLEDEPARDRRRALHASYLVTDLLHRNWTARRLLHMGDNACHGFTAEDDEKHARPQVQPSLSNR